VTAERDWRAVRVAGKLEFNEIGIIARIASVLAEVRVSVYVVSTFSTDYFLVKSDRLDDAISALAHAGYEVTT